MNIYQANFVKNSSISLKQKRLRHISLIAGKNLKVNCNRFHIWFTLHTAGSQRAAFYISDKKENDRNPKWHILNVNVHRLAYKSFICRIWYTNLEETKLVVPSRTAAAAADDRLCLLIEYDVNLDLCVELKENAKRAHHSQPENLLVFEIFGLRFVEAQTQSDLKTPENKSSQEKAKKSYTLNLMNRLHDFQRVIHDTSQKIAQLKLNSMAKFDPTSRIRQLQVKREHNLQRIKFLRESLQLTTEANLNAASDNEQLAARVGQLKRNLAQFQAQFLADKRRFSSLENTQVKSLLRENFVAQGKLKTRQKELIFQLSQIFTIQKSSDGFFRILNSTLKLGSLQGSSSNNNLVILSLDDIKENSVAFGYICHTLLLLATILSVPLRYPIVYRASKSFIIEHFNNELDGATREHPLFDAAQDDSLNLSVALLNKNVTQLRLLFDSYRNFDANEMLVNLKWIFEYFLNIL
jgi:hypothetical protein